MLGPTNFVEMELVKVDIKALLKEYVPSLFNFPIENIGWRGINEDFLEHYNKRLLRLEGQDSINVEANFYDVIGKVLDKDPRFERLLGFLNYVLERLSANLSKKSKGLVVGTVTKVLTNFDTRYLNFVGELAVLNNIVESGNFELLRVESPIGHGKKKAEFLLKKKDNGTEFMLEVLNIHSYKFESDNDGLKKFFDDRAEKKIKQKLGNQSKSDFVLAIVVWTSADQLSILNSFFKQGYKISSSRAYVLEPLVYVNQHNQDGYTKYLFGTVSSIFKILDME